MPPRTMSNPKSPTGASNNNMVRLYSMNGDMAHGVLRTRLNEVGGHFEEMPTGTVRFPDTDENVLNNFIWWLYRGLTGTPSTPLTDWSGITTGLVPSMVADQQQLAVRLWGFGSQYNVDDLAHGAIRHLYIWLARGVPTVELVKEAFQSSQPGNKVRMLLVWKAADGHNETYEGYDPFQVEDLKEIPGFLTELASAQERSIGLGLEGVNDQGPGFFMDNEPVLMDRISREQ